MKYYACPKCHEDESLRITATVWVTLSQDDEYDNFETNVEDFSHEWHGESPMICPSCHFVGVVNDFVIIRNTVENDDS